MIFQSCPLEFGITALEVLVHKVAIYYLLLLILSVVISTCTVFSGTYTDLSQTKEKKNEKLVSGNTHSVV